MKKIIALIIILITSIKVSYSQTYFGVKAGPSIANINFDENYRVAFNQIERKTNRIGYQLGFFAQRDISNKLFMRTELYYSLKGYALYENSSTQKLRVGLNYINLPLLLGYKINHTFSAFISPELAALGPVYAKSRNQSRSRLNNIVNYEHFGVGIAAGTMYTLTPKLSVDLRYTYGLSKILKLDITDEQGNFLYQTGQRNSKALQLSLNYFFRAKV